MPPGEAVRFSVGWAAGIAAALVALIDDPGITVLRMRAGLEARSDAAPNTSVRDLSGELSWALAWLSADRDRGMAPALSPPVRTLAVSIAEAADLAGVDRDTLLRTARRESGLDPYARSPTSSARGLFQFVEQTWLLSLAKWGARHGHAEAAALIRIDADGRAAARDPLARRRLLALRYDPELSARLAAELAAENATSLRAALGRTPTPVELYAAHLLGADGALRLISAAQRAPGMPAAALLPAAARVNRSLFYAGDRPLSVTEFRARLFGW